MNRIIDILINQEYNLTWYESTSRRQNYSHNWGKAYMKTLPSLDQKWDKKSDAIVKLVLLQNKLWSNLIIEDSLFAPKS